MKRTIELALNRFEVTPPSLLDAKGSVASPVQVRVADLLHHYFVAKYGEDAKDSGHYEYENFLTAHEDWRFRGSGIGADKEAKSHASNELGKGFARWFLYEHLGFTYFCPFEDLVGQRAGDGTRWERKEKGDLPDYVCGPPEKKVYLLEAKGRYRSVGFGTKEFESFRAQLGRAQLVDRSGTPISVKGFISAARWSTASTPNVKSKLFVEDPDSEGREPGADGYPRSVSLRMIAGHYVPVLERLRLPDLASAIRDRAPQRAPTGVQRGVWKCVSGPLTGRKFVGGVLPSALATGLAMLP